MRFLIFIIVALLTGCGFHPQGEMKLAPPLKKMYLKTPDPYGTLSRNLRDYLKMSHVQLVDYPSQADTILEVQNDTTTQVLLSVASTQQTRQYKLVVSVNFAISDNKGRELLPTQALAETRAMTVQANQILGSSNEASLYVQQMRRSLAYAILNRLSSVEVTHIINEAFFPRKKRRTTS